MRASRLYSPKLSRSHDVSPRPAISGAVSSRMACVFDVRGSIIRQRSQLRPVPEDAPARCHLRLINMRPPSKSTLNPPCHPPATPDQSAHFRESAKIRPHSGLVDCCLPSLFAAGACLTFPTQPGTASSRRQPDDAQSQARDLDGVEKECSSPIAGPDWVPIP